MTEHDMDRRTDAYDLVTMRELMRLHRERAGMSLGQVGRLAGVSKVHVWELEKGRAGNPTLETLTAIAEAIDVAPVLLFSAWLAERRARAAGIEVIEVPAVLSQETDR